MSPRDLHDDDPELSPPRRAHSRDPRSSVPAAQRTTAESAALDRSARSPLRFGRYVALFS